MPRPHRADEAGGLYHVLNRANARARIFRKEAGFEAFEQILAEGLKRYDVRFFCYQLMPNHWHLVLRPQRDGEMSRVGPSNRTEPVSSGRAEPLVAGGRCAVVAAHTAALLGTRW